MLNMKKLLILLLLLPSISSAQLNVPQGGTGQTSFPLGGWLFGQSSLRLGASSSPTVGWIWATSSSAVSSFAGKVGIGTTSPSAQLGVVDTTGTGIYTESTSTALQAILRDYNGAATSTVVLGYESDGFYTGIFSACNVNNLTCYSLVTLFGLVDLVSDTSIARSLTVGTDPTLYVAPLAPYAPFVAIGTSTSAIPLDGSMATGTLIVKSNSPVDSILINHQAASGFPSPASLLANRYNTVLGVPTILDNGDEIFKIQANGFDGDEYISAASINFNVQGAPATGQMPGDIVFKTSDGSGLADRMTIASAGNVGIGVNSFPALFNVGSVGSGENQLYLASTSASFPSMVIDDKGFVAFGGIDTTNQDLGIGSQFNIINQVSSIGALLEHGSDLLFQHAGISGPFITSKFSRGTFASPTTVGSDDSLFTVIAGGYDGADWRQGGAISIRVDGTPSSNLPTYILAQVTDVNNTVLDAWRATYKGNFIVNPDTTDPDLVTLGGATYGTAIGVRGASRGATGYEDNAIAFRMNVQNDDFYPTFLSTYAREGGGGSNAVPIVADGLLNLVAAGWDGDDYQTGAQITAAAEDTFADGYVPTTLSFLTNSGTGLGTRMSINGAGQVQIGGGYNSNTALTVTGTSDDDTTKIAEFNNMSAEPLFTFRSDGHLGIGTTTPATLLQLFSTATTTFSIDSDSASKGSCIELKDIDGGGYTYVYALNGDIFTSQTSCK